MSTTEELAGHANAIADKIADEPTAIAAALISTLEDLIGEIASVSGGILATEACGLLRLSNDALNDVIGMMSAAGDKLREFANGVLAG